ncbi:MAG: arginine repressor [Arachnia sp.]
MADVARPARLSRLRELLAEERHASQQDLSSALAGDDITVSQSTLSKDLVAVGAIRRRASDGSLVYALGVDGDVPGMALEKLARLAAELLQSIQSTGNQVVLRTPPGAAQFFAATLDAARLPGIMGTIAGDDTVLLIAVDEERAGQVIVAISEMTRTGKPHTPTTQEDDK